MSITTRIANALIWLDQNIICPHVAKLKVGIIYEEIRIECIECGKVFWRYSDDVPREAHEFYVRHNVYARIHNGELDVPRIWEQ